MKVKRSLAGAAVGTLLMFGATVPPVAAQEEAQAQELAQTAEAEDNGFDDWGLLGLLGLLGLAGLAGRKRDDGTTRRAP